jgi:hypothetical protein
VLKFACVFALSLAVCTVGWEAFIAGVVYSCTDQEFLEFLAPGEWYHPRSGDLIMRGWSSSGLWVLWTTMIIVSFVGSWSVAGKQSVGLRTSPESAEL